MNIPVTDIATLRNTIGSIGMNADLTSSNQTYYWDNTSTLTDNGITMINVVGVPVGGWRLQMGDPGATPLSVTSLSGIATKTTIVSKVIKGNLLGTNRIISFIAPFNVSSGLTLLPTATIDVEYGSSIISVASASLVGVTLSNKSCVLQGRIFSNGATNAQNCYAAILQEAGTLGTTGSIVKNGTMTTDSTVDQIFKISVTLSATTGGVTFSFFGANILIL